MKILTIHADFIEFQAKKKAFKGAEEGVSEEKHRIDECLVIFTAVEKRDEANTKVVLEKYLKNIEDIAAQVKATNIVLYPYAHLSSQLSNPQIAESFMKEAEKQLQDKYKVSRAPFGWYKSFNISCKGHPLSELSREFSGESATQEAKILPPNIRESEKEDLNANTTYIKLLDFLDQNKAEYKLIEHSPEGRTEIVSPMRGNKPSQAAKCIIVMVKTKNDERKFILGVVPGDAKINLNVIKDLFQGTYASFATQDIAEELAGSQSGTILPFSFNSKLTLIVDPHLLENEELYFNAARLDRSMVLKTKDYVRLTKPRLEQIADYSQVQVINLKREGKDELFTLDSRTLTTAEKIKLSAAVVLAKVISDLYPKTQLGQINLHHDQSYVDFSNLKLKQEDLARLEKEMQKIIKTNSKFEKSTLSSANSSLLSLQQDIVKDLGKPAATYTFNNISIVPLFHEPFLQTTKEIAAVKLLNISSAYWKNNFTNEQLTRINLVAFASEEELFTFTKKIEDAEARSHLKIGREQNLFVISELVGQGLPLLAPKGTIIRNEIIDYLWQLHKHQGYQQVWTPHIAKDNLYKTSGHWEKFGDDLFKVKGKSDEFVLKPMNCPHHMQIFDSFAFSYRDMPVRYFEPATVYRDEKSGQLIGLSRVRSITQDDGHLFCRVSQIKQEVKTIVNIIHQFYHTIGLDKDYWVSLSIRGDDKSKYLGTDEVWNIAETALEEAANENSLPYRKIKGEAAFYGPKLDFLFKDALGREWQLATIQCDFNLPERFNLSFMNEKSEKERPVVIHRAISGSLERFMSIIIEHYAGKFPLWLSPQQVTIVTVTDRNIQFAEEVVKELQQKNIRVKLNSDSETIGKKVRDAQMEKVNYIVTIGDKECEKKTLAVRTREGEVKFDVPLQEFLNNLKEEIEKKIIR